MEELMREMILAARKKVEALGDEHTPEAASERAALRQMEQVYESKFRPLPEPEPEPEA